MRLIATLLAFSVLVPAAVAQPFDAPWIGYNAGSSAFPGNPAPYERDPYAIEAADLDGDGDMDVVLANYDYAAPGGTSGQSGFAVLFNDGRGVFSEPVHYTFTTKGSFDVVVGDFDEDGDPDLALPNSGRITGEDGNSVVVFSNDGAGAFSLTGEYVVGERPMALAVGDFDADGHLDIAADSYRFDSRAISVLFGTGSGSFAPRVLVPVVNVPSDGLAAVDVDADGDDDIAASVLGDLYVARSNGNRTFATATLVSEAGSQPIVGEITAGDITGDGRIDLVHGAYQASGTHAGKDVVVRPGNGDGTFGAPAYYQAFAYGTTPEAVELVDVDADGDLDVVTCDWSGTTGDGIGILFNIGGGVLGDPHHVPAGQGTADLAVADVNGDGRPDVVTTDRMSMAITVHANPGDGRLPVLATRYEAMPTTVRLDAGDVDGDGDLDVFVSGEATGVPGGLLRNVGGGAFAAPVPYTHSATAGRGVSRARLRDLDGDGDLDLLYNDPHTDFQDGYNFYTAANDGSGAFGPIVTWFINNCGTGDVDAFDVDNDGDLDVVNLEELACVGSPDSGKRIYVSINQGDGTFAHLPPFGISAGPRALAGGDVSGDGIVDLVTSHWTPYGARNVVNVHLGNGNGTFQEESVHVVGQGPMDVLVHDLDGDGHLDIATANSGSDNLPTNQETMSVLWGNGLGAFSDAQTYYAPFSPDLLGATGIAAGDVDRDGDTDLMVTTVAAGVAMYYNDGARGFDFSHRLGIYWRPADPYFADFDGDGVPDLATLVGAPPSGVPKELAILRGIGVTTDGPAAPAPVARELAVSVVPNPVAHRATVTVVTRAAGDVAVEVFDVVGRRVSTLHASALPAGTHAIALSAGALRPGVYVVRAAGRDASATTRVVVSR